VRRVIKFSGGSVDHYTFARIRLGGGKLFNVKHFAELLELGSWELLKLNASDARNTSPPSNILTGLLRLRPVAGQVRNLQAIHGEVTLTSPFRGSRFSWQATYLWG
jgi:hypothetical protein